MTMAGNVRRAIRTTMLAVVALSVIAPASTIDAASDRTPQVVVIKSGPMRGGAGR
jgi:hypothetical protein